MNPLHPKLKESLLNQLPQGAIIESVESLDSDSSVVVVGYHSDLTEHLVSKQDIKDHYRGVKPKMVIGGSVTVSELINKLSEQDNLFLVPGVDYDENNSVVDLKPGLNQFKIKISNQSLFYKGELAVSVSCVQNKILCNTTPVNISLEKEILTLSLLNHLFVFEDTVKIGDSLSVRDASKVRNFIDDLDLKTTISLGEISAGKIISFHHDTVSNLAFVSLEPSHEKISIRYRSK